MARQHTSYDCLQGQIFPWGLAPNSINALGAREKNDATDVHLEPEQLQDRLKDQGDELTEVNIREEGSEHQPIFISASLSADLSQALFDFLKNSEMFLHWHVLRW